MHHEPGDLTHDEALQLLRTATVGRIAFTIGDQPYALPVNIAADEDGWVVFRTSEHSALSSLSGHKVAVEVDAHDAVTRSGWCVVVLGDAREITTAPDPVAGRLRSLDVRPWAGGVRERWFAVLPTSISGRRVAESGHTVGDWFAGIPGS